jgi:hypothetical protein
MKVGDTVILKATSFRGRKAIIQRVYTDKLDLLGDDFGLVTKKSNVKTITPLDLIQ